MKMRMLLVPLMVAVIMGASASMVSGVLWFCCEDYNPLDICSGCRGVDDDANEIDDQDWEYYIIAPNTPGLKCKATGQSGATCASEWKDCGSAGPVTKYEDDPWLPGFCNTAIGIELSVIWKAPQCESPPSTDCL